MSETARERWEDHVEWPLTVLAVLFLGAYAWPILDPGIAREWRVACDVVDWVAWVAFAVDYLVRLALSRARGAFVRANVLDLVIVALPLLRPLRVLRLVTLLNVLNRHAGTSLRGRVAVYVVAATTLVVFVSALAVLSAERGHPGANIGSFGESLWWAMTTVTTVGYGDVYPVTVTGRLVAVCLMLVGIALIGVVTATFASWLISKVGDDTGRAATTADLDRLAAQVAALREELARTRGG